MNFALLAGGAGLLLFFALLFGIYKWKQKAKLVSLPPAPVEPEPVPLVHRLCPVQEIIQGLGLEKKDSLDDHLDVLTKQLAEQEGRLRISRSKMRETQYEVENLRAIDQDMTDRYKEVLETLKSDMQSNEKHCLRLQEQIEWVSKRRAEIRDEVLRAEKQYSKAAVELASNLIDLQRGRITDKPHDSIADSAHSFTTVRLRKDPHLVNYPAMAIKSPTRVPSTEQSTSVLV